MDDLGVPPFQETPNINIGKMGIIGCWGLRGIKNDIAKIWYILRDCGYHGLSHFFGGHLVIHVPPCD